MAMGIYQALPGTKVLGATIKNTVESLELYKDVGYKLLAKAGISDLKEDEWYDQQMYCDFLDMLKQKVGPSTLFIAGRNIGMNAPLPPVLNSPAMVLAGFDQVYKSSHKGVPANQGWVYSATGENKATMICNSPYPDDLSRGVCDGFVRRFKTGALFVKIDEAKPRIDNGGKTTTFLIQW
jgi:hypothetical protein